MHSIIAGTPQHAPQPHYARTIIFADEKPFRLYDSQSGAGYALKDANGHVPENNVAKKLTTENAATADEKYIEFMDRVKNSCRANDSCSWNRLLRWQTSHQNWQLR